MESELVSVRDQYSQLTNEVSQLNNTIADLRGQLVTAEQDVTLVKQEASQLQEDNRNKTCASYILIIKMQLTTVSWPLLLYANNLICPNKRIESNSN